MRSWLGSLKGRLHWEASTGAALRKRKLLNEEVAYKKGRARDLRDPKNGGSQIIQNG